MAETKIYSHCQRCNGTGKIERFDEHGTPLPPGPCDICDGSGRVLTSLDIDPELETKVDSLVTNMVTVLEQLDYIHGKVTAIWEQVKPH